MPQKIEVLLRDNVKDLGRCGDLVQVAPGDVVWSENQLDDVAPGAGPACRAVGAAGICAVAPDEPPGGVMRRIGAVIAVIGNRQHERRAAMRVEAGRAVHHLARENGRIVDRARPDELPPRIGDHEQPPRGP